MAALPLSETTSSILRLELHVFPIIWGNIRTLSSYLSSPQPCRHPCRPCLRPSRYRPFSATTQTRHSNIRPNLLRSTVQHCWGWHGPSPVSPAPAAGQAGRPNTHVISLATTTTCNKQTPRQQASGVKITRREKLSQTNLV